MHVVVTQGGERLQVSNCRGLAKPINIAKATLKRWAPLHAQGECIL